MTIQVRTPSGQMVTNLIPTTRCTIKIRQDPSFVEQKKMYEIMDKLERTMSQNQKQLPNVISKPEKVYT